MSAPEAKVKSLLAVMLCAAFLALYVRREWTLTDTQFKIDTLTSKYVELRQSHSREPLGHGGPSTVECVCNCHCPNSNCAQSHGSKDSQQSAVAHTPPSSNCVLDFNRVDRSVRPNEVAEHAAPSDRYWHFNPQEGTKWKPQGEFALYRPWSGYTPAGFYPDFLGWQLNASWWRPEWLDRNFGDHGNGAKDLNRGRWIDTQYTPITDQYWEELYLLRSVREAEGSYVIIELGAAFGMWTGKAASALRYLRPDIPHSNIKLVMVEADPIRCGWAHPNFAVNGVDPSILEIMNAAVGESDGTLYSQRLTASAASENYGHSILASCPDNNCNTIPMHSLPKMLAKYGKVDFLDFDVQGAEWLLFNSAANRAAMKKHVVYLYVECHPHDGNGDIGEQRIHDTILGYITGEMGFECMDHVIGPGSYGFGKELGESNQLFCKNKNPPTHANAPF